MKNIAVFSIILIQIAGCVPINKTIEGGVVRSILDFTEYTDKGFLFTPEKYSGEYESIGLIEYDFMATATCEKYTSPSTGMTARKWNPQPFDVRDGLNNVYNEVIGLGGNALMNLDINYLEESSGLAYHCQDNEYFPGGYIIRGFAIRISE